LSAPTGSGWGEEIGGELGFEVGESLVEEAVVLAGAGQAFPDALIVLGELPDLLLQGSVLGNDPLEWAFGEDTILGAWVRSISALG
jgi:hypothetical protein